MRDLSQLSFIPFRVENFLSFLPFFIHHTFASYISVNLKFHIND